MSLKKALKRLGKKAKKAAKSVGKVTGVALRVAAPVVAAVVPGVGKLISVPIAAGGAALKGGDRKKKMSAFKRTMTQTGASLLGTSALGLISGQGIGASAIQSVSGIFNPAASAGSGTSGLDDSSLESNGGVPGSGLPSSLANAFIGGGTSGIFPGGVPGGSGVGSPTREQGPIGDTPEGRVMDTINAGNAEEAPPSKRGFMIAAGIGAAALGLYALTSR